MNPDNHQSGNGLQARGAAPASPWARADGAQGLFTNEMLCADVRHVIDALLATAIGTLAGILVDSGYSVRSSVLNAVYRLLGPVFDAFSAFPNSQLVLAGFIQRIPAVLLIGMLAGLILRYFRYPRPVLVSSFVWMGYLQGRKFAMLLPGAGDAEHALDLFQLVPGLVLYTLQYGLLVIVIAATNTVLARSTTR